MPRRIVLSLLITQPLVALPVTASSECVSRSRHAGFPTTAILRLRPPIPVGARLFPEVPGAAETQEDQDTEQKRLVFY